MGTHPIIISFFIGSPSSLEKSAPRDHWWSRLLAPKRRSTLAHIKSSGLHDSPQEGLRKQGKTTKNNQNNQQPLASAEHEAAKSLGSSPVGRFAESPRFRQNSPRRCIHQGDTPNRFLQDLVDCSWTAPHIFIYFPCFQLPIWGLLDT